MSRTEVLSAVKSGMTRLRVKGGASKESLYDLRDGYVTANRSVVPRPGSRRLHTIPGTKGVCVFGGKYVVFASTVVASPSPDVIVEVLTHPVAGSTAQLAKIHFAKPFLGYLYVVAEWDDDPTIAYHYYLQSFGTWTADTPYPLGAVMQAQIANGYAYVAERLTSPDPVWVAKQPRTVAQKVEPTIENGYKYEVIAVYGTTPSSGVTEPTWPVIEGAVVIEETDGVPAVSIPPTDTGTGGNTTLPPNVGTRYDNMGGSDPRRNSAEQP